MSKERELLERALQLIDDAYEGKIALSLCNEIKELLAKPEHIVDVTDKVEPVAWMWKKHTAGGWLDVVSIDKPTATAHQINIRPLYYTAPSQREPLSDDEMRAIWKEGVRGEIPFVEIGRAIEKAHGIGGGNER